MRQRLARAQTSFQAIELIDTDLFGRCLILDGALQTTEWDEFMYHEMLVHVPLFTHPNPRNILIIGGGDGGTLRRVLEHPATQPVQVEIDPAVIDQCRKYIPAISNGAFSDPRAKVVIGDGFEFIRNRPAAFDVILVDSTDPVGPAVPLFEEPFYRDVSQALTDDGLLAAQSNSPIYMASQLKAQLSNLRAVFPIVRTYIGLVPTYPGGVWSFTIASKRHDPTRLSLDDLSARVASAGLTTRYYTPQIHQAAFVLPPFIAELVGSD